MFDSSFELSDSAPVGVARAQRLPRLQPGVYQSGLLTLLDEKLGEEVLRHWRWLIGSDATALAVTAFGDIFFWSDRFSSVYFLEVQRGHSTFVDKEIDYLFNEFLPQAGVKDKVLAESKLERLVGRLGELCYGECYLAEPWQMLGGSGSEESFVKGKVNVYASLVGQALERAKTAGQAG